MAISIFCRRALTLHRRKKGSYGAVIRLLPTSPRYENYILPADRFDLPRRDQPPGIGQQHDFKEDFGIICGLAALVIPVFAIKNG
jgi:hypothetical protein